ncbi:hypothetical protein FACS1894187_24220 [Synergistales bacterium]|nr:hypothetical protein FACS1894187_24220 [Synergistales bacterium]
MVFWAGRTSYEPLYAGLEVNDQAAIVAYLKENNIPYQLDSISNAILLPQGQIYEARLALAQEGLPKGTSTGFEIFDDSKMGMSEFQQKIAYIRAREGELQRTIAQLDSVEFSKVSIIIPEERLFLAQQRPSTASVLLKLRAGSQLGSPQIKAILHLVSRSVDGLLPENVTIVDTTGRILSDLVGEDLIYSFDSGNSVKSIQRDLERQREKEMELRVRQMLEQVFGPGSVSVRVTMDLDFDKISRSSREYYPNADTGQGVPRSTARMEESYAGQSQPPGGVPGTTTNIPGYAVNTQNIARVVYAALCHKLTSHENLLSLFHDLKFKVRRDLSQIGYFEGDELNSSIVKVFINLSGYIVPQSHHENGYFFSIRYIACKSGLCHRRTPSIFL